MSSIETSAPGKIILAGEHSAVYGRPALVAALNLRLRVILEERREPGVAVILPELGYEGEVSCTDLREYAGAVRRRWLDFERDPSPAAFHRLRGRDPAHLVKVALGEILAGAPQADPGWRLSVDSDLPVGCGMGSSAALAAAVTLAALLALGVEVSSDQLGDLVLDCERRQHGSPSGVDGAVVLRGGVVWAERRGSGELDLEDVDAGAAGVLGDLVIVNTGAPAQTTGEVVASVRELHDRDAAVFAATLDRLEEAARELRRGLEQNQGSTVAAALTEAERGLETLGVVPAEVIERIRRVEGAGGAAKVSGAGAIAGSGAGCLVVYHPDPSADLGGLLPGAGVVPAALGAAGAAALGAIGVSGGLS